MKRTKDNDHRWEAERELAKTWLVTVVNPLLEHVAHERYFLERKNWTWHYESRRFEFLLPLYEYIEPRYLPNFEQFYRRHREVSGKGKSHDQLLKALEQIVGKAFDVLINCEPFKRAYDTCLTRSKSLGFDTSWASIGQSSLQGLHRVAEYVVNNIDELPSDYSTAQFWQVHHSTLSSIASEHARELFHRIHHRGIRLQKVDGELNAALERVRSGYLRKFSIPPVPIVAEFL